MIPARAPARTPAPHWNDEHDRYAHDLLFGAGALLLGRQTYEGFAAAWSERNGDE